MNYDDEIIGFCSRKRLKMGADIFEMGSDF